MSLVSIVIPTYNRARDLERALKSVLAQSYSAWEALVVDNYSTDDTVDAVERLRDSRIKFFQIHNDGIIAASRNMGIRKARGEYVAFLDSDDWWTPDKLEVSVSRLRHGAEVVYHDLFAISKPGRALPWRRMRTRELQIPVFDDLIANGNAMTTSSVVVGRRVIDAIHGFSESRPLVAAEDYEAWLRAAKVTDAFARIPKTLGYYSVWPGNTSNPTRLLENLDALEQIYAEAFRSLHADISWLNYWRGRSYYKLGSYEKAHRYLKLVHLRRAPLAMYVRSYWLRLLMTMAGRPSQHT